MDHYRVKLSRHSVGNILISVFTLATANMEEVIIELVYGKFLGGKEKKRIKIKIKNGNES